MKTPILIIFVAFSIVTLLVKSSSESIIQEIRNTTQYMTLTLYTRALRDNPITLTYDNWPTAQRNLMFDKEFKFVTHGWQSSCSLSACTLIRDAYLEARDVNVILMDWSTIANRSSYLRPAKLALFVGRSYGRFINFMVENGVPLESIHIIGHSLGAVASSVAVRSIKSGRVARFTELDPAPPGIWGDSVLNLIEGLGAHFVDAIYSALGFSDIIFDNDVRVQFFPNGGNLPQPGCSTNVSCSHGRSYEYFAESINLTHRFVSRKCDTWIANHFNHCGNVTTLMGDPVDLNATGMFYLRTNSEYPYAQGERS